MELGGLTRIGAAAVAADPCILAEALVRLHNEEESVAIAQYPELLGKEISTLIKIT